MTAPSPVLMLTNQLWTGGAERLVVDTTRRMVADGASVHLAATPGELVDALDPRVAYTPVHLHYGRALSPRALLALRRLVSRVRPAVVISHSAATNLAAALVAPSVPRVAIAHGWPAWKYPAAARMLSRADRVVAVSQEVARQLLSWKLDPDRVKVVPNGIDLDRFTSPPPDRLAAARQELGADTDDLVVVHVGRLVAQKRQERILAAAARLCRTHPRLRWAIIGRGPREAELRQRIRELELTDRVRLLGHRDDVPILLASADLYVSTSDWEGLPLAMIEAMAAGLPVVASDVEGARTLLDGDRGVIVPLGDAGALDAAIGRLADDEVRRGRLGAAARQGVLEEFGEDGMMARLYAVLGDAIAAHG